MRRAIAVLFALVITITAMVFPCYATADSISWTEDEIAFMEKHPVIRLGVDPGFVPFEYFDEDGVYVGIAPDYLALISDRTGLQFEVAKGLTWPEAYALAQAGDLDVLPAIDRTEDREKHFLFSRPYYNIKRVIVTRDTDTGISGVEDLRGKVASVQRNSSHHSFLLSYPEINLSLYESFEEGLTAVAMGTEKVFVGNLATADYFIRSNGLTNLRFVAFDSESQQALHFAVRKDWPELVTILNKALDSITESEKYEINDKWILVEAAFDYNFGPLIRILAAIGAVIAIVMAVSVYWISRLRDEISQRKQIQEDLEIAQRALEQRFQEQEVIFETIFDQMPVGIAISHSKDPNAVDESKYFMNPAFEKLTGRSKEELLKQGWIAITHPDDVEEDLRNYERLMRGEIDAYEMDKRVVRPDGSIVWVHMLSATFVLPESDQFSQFALFRDITERKEIAEKLVESERSKSILLSNLPGMAYKCKYDRDWTMLFVSAGCLQLTGYAPESLLHNKELSYNDMISPEYRELLWKELERIVSEKRPFQYEYEIVTASGEHKWVLELGQVVYNDMGEVEALEGIVLDISDRKEMENNLRYINTHDRWTGLYNREYLETLLVRDNRVKNTAKRALVNINLSTFQEITARHGFHYTQDLIKKASEALKQYCSERCMLFKTKENRFTFYIKGYVDKKELVNFCEFVRDTLRPLLVKDRVGGGIGILELGSNPDHVDLLMKNVLIASERSIKISGKEFGVCFYDDNLEALVKREEDIRLALSQIAADDDGGNLFLQYQPILDLKTDSICCFEALARLKTEELGLVSPGEFIPIAEKTDLIIPIGEKVMIKAFRFLNRLRAQGFEGPSISINVSAIQLLSPNFVDRLFELIHEMRVDPHNIGIEITESVFASDYNYINNIMSKLRNAGFHVAIDDFGSAYSSLTRVREINVSTLKIDKFFIDKLMTVGPDKSISGEIIAMAHRLGHDVIAEGVEHEEQKQYLLEHGCDKIQGYLISRPLDEEAAMEIIFNQDGSCN